MTEEEMVVPSEFAEEVAELVDQAFAQRDVDDDGRLSFTEFKEFMLNSPEMVQILYSVFEERRPEDKKKVLEEFEAARKLSVVDQLKELISTNASIEEETKQIVEHIMRYDGDIKKWQRKNLEIMQRIRAVKDHGSEAAEIEDDPDLEVSVDVDADDRKESAALEIADEAADEVESCEEDSEGSEQEEGITLSEAGIRARRSARASRNAQSSGAPSPTSSLSPKGLAGLPQVSDCAPSQSWSAAAGSVPPLPHWPLARSAAPSRHCSCRPSSNRRASPPRGATAHAWGCRGCSSRSGTRKPAWRPGWSSRPKPRMFVARSQHETVAMSALAQSRTSRLRRPEVRERMA